jgi:hypothetical protein
MRMDAKIDMLHRSGLLGKSPSKVGQSLRKSGENDTRMWGLKEVSRIVCFANILIPTTLLRSCKKKPTLPKMIMPRIQRLFAPNQRHPLSVVAKPLRRGLLTGQVRL